MSQPKLHHYVPQFHLRRFTDAAGRLWLWDRDRDRIFPARPKGIAAENNFYWLDVLAEQGHDPLAMEKQFAGLEGDPARITDQWLGWLAGIAPGNTIEIPDVNREIISLYVALQFLRTAETRTVLALFAEESRNVDRISHTERRRLHTDMLWDDKVFQPIADRIRESTWIFGRNTTATPFVTSDNPVAFRTGDNAMWLKMGFQEAGTYVVFPLAPDIVMYCHPKEPPWDKLARFDRCLSPVVFTDSMAESENSGQVFMASQFVISRRNQFEHERDFAKTIGTDTYARDRSVGAENSN